MKLVAAIYLLVAVLSFGTVARAQCIDIPSCVGENAENKERVKAWMRETAVSARETEAARPTSTSPPTATERPTKTPAPTMTATNVATSTTVSTPTITPMPTVTERTPETPVPAIQQSIQPQSPNWTRIIASVIGIPALFLALLWAIARLRKVL